MLKTILAVAVTLGGGVGAWNDGTDGTGNGGGGDDKCPDYVVVPLEAEIKYHRLRACGSSLSATVGGVRIESAAGQCPLFVTILPPCDGHKHRPGSATYTVPRKVLRGVRLDYDCVKHWLLGFIPIVVGSTCVLVREAEFGRRTHYVQYACPVSKPGNSARPTPGMGTPGTGTPGTGTPGMGTPAREHRVVSRARNRTCDGP